MKIPRVRFNLYLLAWLTLALLGAGCQTSDKPKGKGPQATLRLHIETTPDASGATQTTDVSIHRANPITIKVAKDSVLDERQVEEARVVDDLGGFSLEIKFNTRGTWALEQCTMAGRGRRCAIFSTFGEGTYQSRWLAAPVLNHRISDGVLVFTPDATREEAEVIAEGLNNTTKARKKKELP